MKKSILFAFVGALIFSACGKKSTESQTVAPQEKKIMTLAVQSCSVPFRFPAQLHGRQDISIVPQVSALLDEVLVTEGQRVKKGQVMFRLNQNEYRSLVESAQANVKIAKSKVQTAKLEADAKKTLLEKNIISDHEYQVAANQLMVAEAQQSEAVATLNRTKNDLSHTVITAPSEGVVGNINYRQGSLVGPSISQPLTIVSDNSVIYAYTSFTETRYIQMVRTVGSKEKLLAMFPECELVLNDETIYEHKGRVETLSGVIDPHTGAISVRVAYPNPDGLLTAGGSGNIQMNFDYEGIVIPRSATYELQDKTFVYKVTTEGEKTIAKATPIEVYRLNETEYIVFSGIEAGEKIVTEGVRKMHDGQEIIVVE